MATPARPSIFEASTPLRRTHRPLVPPTASTVERTGPLDTIDQQIAAILDAPLRASEPAYAAFAAKEAQLRTLFATLTVWESRALHGRLVNQRADDVVAQKFGRLTVERRQRLLDFLADCRRREAIVAARR